MEKMRHGFKIRKRSINWSAQGRGEQQIGKETRMKFHFSAGKLLFPPGNDGISATSTLTCLGSSKERRFEERVWNISLTVIYWEALGRDQKNACAFKPPPLHLHSAMMSWMSRMHKVSADIVRGEGSVSQAESCLHAQSKRTENSFSKKMITPQEQPWWSATGDP